MTCTVCCGGVAAEDDTSRPYAWGVTPTGTARGARTRPVIDLHAHSTVSDGTETPNELVAAAAVAGVDVLAITDHDTVAGWAEAAEAALVHGVTLVRGIEISCAWRHSSIHLLGYLTDADDGPLRAGARSGPGRHGPHGWSGWSRSWPRTAYPWGTTRCSPRWAPARPPGVPTSRTPSSPTARSGTGTRRSSRWLGNDSPYYVGHYAPDPVRAVELVRAAGGVPVIAHPFTRTRTGVLDDALIERMRDAGLVGLEAYHRDHGPEEVARATALAGRLGLLLTGSSDYHGAGKRNRLAENTTAPEVFEALEAASSGVTEVLRPGPTST